LERRFLRRWERIVDFFILDLNGDFLKKDFGILGYFNAWIMIFVIS
jgi:hypothetical protein